MGIEGGGGGVFTGTQGYVAGRKGMFGCVGVNRQYIIVP